MNIYALKDHKVKCTNLSGGYAFHQDAAKKYLEVGEVYTVKETYVDSWHTDVLLQEFPDIKFNSVFFVDVSKQSPEDDKKHSHYLRYNLR